MLKVPISASKIHCLPELLMAAFISMLKVSVVHTSFSFKLRAISHFAVLVKECVNSVRIFVVYPMRLKE